MIFLYFAVNLDLNFDLKARKVASTHCLEINWNKAESGACTVKYTLALKSHVGDDLLIISVDNIGEIKLCNLPTFASISDVKMMVTFKTTSKIVKTKVFDEPASIETLKTPGM